LGTGSSRRGGSHRYGRCRYLLYQISKLKKKGNELQPGQEAQFTDQDAKLFEKIFLALHKKGKLAD
jgi:hypothetical protein